MRSGSHLSSHHNIAVSFPQNTQVVRLTVRLRVDLQPRTHSSTPAASSHRSCKLKGCSEGGVVGGGFKLPEDLSIMRHLQHGHQVKMEEGGRRTKTGQG